MSQEREVKKKLTEAEERKIIERTAKRDAYLAAYLWSKCDETPGSAGWYAKRKADDYDRWLNEQGYEYDYQTATVRPK